QHRLGRAGGFGNLPGEARLGHPWEPGPAWRRPPAAGAVPAPQRMVRPREFAVRPAPPSRVARPEGPPMGTIRRAPSGYPGGVVSRAPGQPEHGIRSFGPGTLGGRGMERERGPTDGAPGSVGAR